MTLYSTPPFFSFALRALRKYPDRVAFEQAGYTLRYHEVIALVARMQRVMRQEGLGKGHVMALLSENRPDVWCAWLAAQGLGMATTWLHPLGSRDSQTFQLRDVGAHALVVDTDAFGERLAELSADHPTAVAFGLGQSPQVVGLDLLALAAAQESGEPLDDASPNDIANLNYTGGTTGRQKGVVRRSAQVTQMAIAMRSELEIPDAPQYLAIAAISHVSGQLILPTFLRGGTVHLLKRFDPAEVLQTIERERITMTLMVPTMIYKVLQTPLEQYDLSSLELIVYAGSVIAPERLAEAISRMGPIFSQVYAQTECTPIAVLRKSDHRLDEPATLQSCGFAVGIADVRVLDERGNEQPACTVGELCVRSPSVMTEYLGQPEMTAETLEGGWLHTGDLGYIDATGRIFIVDRKKDMIVSGGFNVYPREVEDALSTHPAVNSSAVYGVPHAQWGEAVWASVVLRRGATVDADTLITHVRQLKGPLLTPKNILFADDLPTTPFGKVDKKALRAPHWEGRERAVS